jgi:zinc/manganese transport system ATP-binding protein
MEAAMTDQRTGSDQRVQAGQPAEAGQPGAAGQGGEEVLTVEGVSVRLSGREVLHDVRFSIRRGEFVGLIGSNGAGKTTLLRVILGLQATTAGQVRIAGQDRSRRGARIGYVPQKILLDPDLPVRARDLVGLGLDGHRFGFPLPSRARRQRVDEMLRAVDADRFADARVGNLSGGEQQRVLIAHALISEPQLLLLDEPLANLDIRSEQEIIALLARIARQEQIAVLISAHEMNPLLPVMDRIVYMAAGRAASGRTDEVVRPDVLSALYGQHVDVITVHDRILVVAGRGDGPDIPDESEVIIPPHAAPGYP